MNALLAYLSMAFEMPTISLPLVALIPSLPKHKALTHTARKRDRETTHNFTLACTQTNKTVLIGVTGAFILMLLSIDQLLLSLLALPQPRSLTLLACSKGHIQSN